MAMLNKLLKERKSFILGLATGFCAALLLVVLGGYIMIDQGVTVEFNAEELARTVSQQVEAQAKLQLPRFIDQAKSELPKTMAEQATEEFARTNIQFFNVSIKLPPEALEAIEKQLEINFKSSLDYTLTGANLDGIAQEVGKNSYKLTKDSLEKQFNGKTFLVRTYGWVNIPVTVEIN